MMDKFQRTKAIPEQLRCAVVPKPLLKRFIFGRSIRCAGCIALAVLMIIPLIVLPGSVLFVLPAEIVLMSRISDEVELINWVRDNMVTQESGWDDVESETEIARLRAHERSNIAQGFSR